MADAPSVELCMTKAMPSAPPPLLSEILICSWTWRSPAVLNGLL